jgi:hypothetical protein
MQYTPDNITTLEYNQIFVFGSNLAGRHGRGAALIARERFDAKYGEGIGRTGQCYAIPTKDQNIQTLPISRIHPYIIDFFWYAVKHPELEFLVSRVGCGLAGYKPKDIAPLFVYDTPDGIPKNMILPKDYWEAILDTTIPPCNKRA